MSINEIVKELAKNGYMLYELKYTVFKEANYDVSGNSIELVAENEEDYFNDMDLTAKIELTPIHARVRFYNDSIELPVIQRSILSKRKGKSYLINIDLEKKQMSYETSIDNRGLKELVEVFKKYDWQAKDVSPRMCGP